MCHQGDAQQTVTVPASYGVTLDDDRFVSVHSETTEPPAAFPRLALFPA